MLSTCKKKITICDCNFQKNVNIFTEKVFRNILLCFIKANES